MNLEFYQLTQLRCQEELKRWNRQYNICSIYRGITAVCACVGFITGFYLRQSLYYYLGAALAAVFLLLIRWHNQIEKQQAYYASKETVSKDYLDRCGVDFKQFRQFKHQGSEYLSEEFTFAKDLDLFGPGSLYQYICTANTTYGSNRLAEWLLKGSPDLAAIKKRQEAVKELALNIELTSDFETFGRIARIQNKDAGDDVIREFIEEVQSAKKEPLLLKLLIWGLPAITCYFLVLVILQINLNQNVTALVYMTGLQLLLAIGGYVRNGRILGPIHRFSRCIKPYRQMFSLIEQAKFQSEYLKELQDEISEQGGASQAFGFLNRIGEAASARYNGMAFLIYNSLLLWDFHCSDRFHQWGTGCGPYLKHWMEILGEMEALISLTVLCSVKKSYTFPEMIESDTPVLSFHNLKHPLIEESKAVGNDLTLTHQTCMITGSNMSGKTTFMRSIGVNLALAYAGGPVLADDFCTSRMQLLTSMRIEDNVNEGISTFYAELLRIKHMADVRKQGKPMIALIDEIYKGTNSKDRILGARETIKKLAGPQVVMMITTHDFELCDLEDDPLADAVNYHFTETYTDKEITFDYKIRNGRCQTTNAQYLLRMAGIL